MDKQTALVLIDFQVAVLASLDAAKRTDLVAHAQKLLLGARQCAMPVMHVGVARLRQRGGYDSPRTDMALRRGAAPRDLMPLVPGSPEADFIIEPLHNENVFHKIGVSAFAGTSLDMALRGEGVTKVLVAGIYSHMAVESTVRQGFDLGYTMVVAEDACACPDTALHERAMQTLAYFGRVSTVREICPAYFGSPAD